MRDFSSGSSIDGVAFTASSLVTLPSFPVPLTEVVGIFFSSKIFLAAGGCPEAYVAAGAAAAGVGLVQLPFLALQQQEPLGCFCSRTF
jgi:hypothetical protein